MYKYITSSTSLTRDEAHYILRELYCKLHFTLCGPLNTSSINVYRALNIDLSTRTSMLTPRR